MNKNELNNTLSTHLDSVSNTIVRFRRAVSEFSDVMDYFLKNKNIRYELCFSVGSIYSLYANVYTTDYELVISAIKKHRPYLVIPVIEIKDDYCTFYLNHNNEWKDVPVEPKLIREEDAQKEMLKMSTFRNQHD